MIVFKCFISNSIFYALKYDIMNLMVYKRYLKDRIGKEVQINAQVVVAMQNSVNLPADEIINNHQYYKCVIVIIN